MPTNKRSIKNNDDDVHSSSEEEEEIQIIKKKLKPSTSTSRPTPSTSTISAKPSNQPLASTSTSASSSTSTSKPTHPMFQPRAALGNVNFRWHPNLGSPPTCLHGTYGSPTGSRKIAAFDIDGTLIKNKSGNQFPKNAADWELWSDKVVPTLHSAVAKGYAIVLISNQCYKGKRLEWFQQKIPNLALALQVPFHVFAATAKDGFRKPDIGMWTAYARDFNDEIEIDMEASYYVGDAAGRKQPKDHSDTDLGMANAAGLPFSTPEKYFV